MINRLGLPSGFFSFVRKKKFMYIFLGILLGIIFLGLIILFFWYEGVRKKRMLEQFSNEELGKIDAFSREIKYNERQTQNFAMQCFESIEILRNTKNLKTFKSRLELFEKRYFQLVQISTKGGYFSSYNKTKQLYLKKYYDRNLTKEMLDLEQPREFNYNAFLESIFSKLSNRLKQQTDEKINSLKTDRAKENAKSKLREELLEVKTMVKEMGLVDNKNLQNIFND